MREPSLNDFINTYVKKRYRFRLRREIAIDLKNPDFFNRFAYNAGKMLIKKKIVLEGIYIGVFEIRKYFEINNIDLPCVAVVYTQNNSVTEPIPYEQAYDLWNDNIKESILLTDNGFALIKQEFDYDDPPYKIILKNI